VDRLAELRESQALTLRDLAERSGVDANTINQVELGHRKPRPSTLRKLAKALDVDVRELFEEPALSGKVEAPATGLSIEEFLVGECGHAYIARDHEAVIKLIQDADPLMVDGTMDQLRQEIEALSKERKKYPALEHWRWKETFTDYMSKYLRAGIRAQQRSPERQKAAERMLRELEGEAPLSAGDANS